MTEENNKSITPEKYDNSGNHLEYWDTENDQFWVSEGKNIANRNLWISIPNLLFAFSIWIIWSIIIVKIETIHIANPDVYQFKDMGDLSASEYSALLYTLPAVAGLAGATLRVPNSFMISNVGGRITIALTTLLLFIPMLALGILLKNPDVPFTSLVIIAVITGVGGGAFSSSMSNISFFYPKKVQGTSLGLNAGLGNLGVSVMQLLVPLVMTIKLFGALSGDAYSTKSGTIYISNGALVWVPLLAIFSLAAWFRMNSLPQHDVSNTKKSVLKFTWLESIGFIAAGFSAVLLIIDWGEAFKSPGLKILRLLILVVIAVLITLALMKYATPTDVKDNLNNQFKIFNNKHNWIMTYLYIMTFGSFIGFSASFPKLIFDSFGLDPSSYAWLGAFVGSIARPIGGKMSDKWGGAKVTQWDTVVMILSTVGVGWILILAKNSSNPETYFPVFLILFLLLFITTGIGNGSTYRMVPIIFEKEQAGPVLGWIAAIAAYGAFIIPSIFAITRTQGVPEVAMFGFAVYYFTCLVLNWWYYARKNAEMPC